MDEEEALDDSIYSEIAAVDKAFLEVIEGQPADSFARKVTQAPHASEVESEDEQTSSNTWDSAMDLVVEGICKCPFCGSVRFP